MGYNGWNASCHALAAAELGIAKELMALIDPSSLRKQKQTVVNNKTSILEEVEDKNPEAYDDVSSELELMVRWHRGQMFLRCLQRCAPQSTWAFRERVAFCFPVGCFTHLSNMLSFKQNTSRVRSADL